MFKIWNALLFIGGGREIFFLYWYQILFLDSNRKNPNCWFKVVKMNCQNLTTQDCMSWPFWGGTEAVVVSINQKDPYHGMVKCQTIMVVYDLSSLFERWRIKCSEKIATQVAFEWKNDEEGEQYKTTCFSYFSYSNFSCYSNWYFFMSFFLIPF